MRGEGEKEMRIGLVDVDGHNFPNLALMKLATYHKQRGDEVEWAFPLLPYDRVYMAKVFTFSQDDITAYQADEIVSNYRLLQVILNDANYCTAVGEEDIGYKVYVNPDREVCFSVTTAKGFEPNRMIQVDHDPLVANPKLANLL